MALWGDPRIQQLLDTLELESPLPPKAARYHRLREGLLDELRRFQKRRLPRRGKNEEAERLLRRGENLLQVRPQLQALLEQAEGLQQSILDFERRAASIDDIAQPFSKRCSHWSQTLESLGSMAGRPSEMIQDRAALQEIEEHFRLHSQALELVAEAERRAGQLEGDERRSWEDQLIPRRREIAEGPLAPQSVQGLRRWLEDRPAPPPHEPSPSLELPPLPPALPVQPPAPPPSPSVAGPEEAAAQESHSEEAEASFPEPERSQRPEPEPQPPPQQRSPQQEAEMARQRERAADLLDEARIWLRELGEGPEQLQQLQQRFGKTPVHWEDWDGPQSREFLAAVEELAEQLRQRASYLRREKRQSMQEYVREYCRLLDSDQGLQADLQRLERLAADSPEKHARWLEVAQEVESRFRGTAALHQDRLQESLAASLEALQKEADQFSQGPLFEEDRQRMEEIRQQLRQAAGLSDLDSILDGLLASKRLRDGLEGLRASVDEIRSRHLKRKASLLGRDQELIRAGQRAEHPVESLKGRIEEIEGQASSELASLRESEQHMQRIASLLDEQQRRLIEGCREQIEQLTIHCQEAATALRPLPQASNLERLQPSLPADDDLETVLSCLEQARQARDRADATLQEAIDQLESKRQQIRRDLEALPSSLPYGQSRRSQHLQALFQEDSFRGIQDPLLLLSKLQKTVERGEAFREAFYRNQRRVQEYRRTLPRRLTEFEGRGLQRYAPRLVLDRLTSLIEGVPDPPSDWPCAVRQLEEAEALLTRLERHARRLAASRLDS